MKKLLIGTAAVAAVAVPVAAQAQSPSPQDSKNAAKYCKSLKTAAGSAEAFRSSVDTVVAGKVTAKNAYGKCVSFYAKDEAKERASVQKQAVSACKAERDAATTDAAKQAFASKYGAKNVSSAYGKCVSSTAKAKKDDADAADQARVNAAQQCRSLRGTTTASQQAFDAKYATFGKCVSEKAHAA